MSNLIFFWVKGLGEPGLSILASVLPVEAPLFDSCTHWQRALVPRRHPSLMVSHETLYRALIGGKSLLQFCGEPTK